MGDSAYPLFDWLIPPYKDNGNLSALQKHFNFVHSSARVVIEHAFGLLKGRFRRLKFFDNDNITFIVKCVIAATVLHNLCSCENDIIEIDVNEDSDNENYDDFLAAISGVSANSNRREEILQQLFS